MKIDSFRWNEALLTTEPLIESEAVLTTEPLIGSEA